jgi:ribonuclease P protein component
MWSTTRCGQLTSMWFARRGWRRCPVTSSLARSVHGTRAGRGARLMCIEPSGVSREAYLPAQQPSPSPQARVSCSDEHPRRPCRAQVPSGQGPRSPVGLIDRVRQRDGFVRIRRDGARVRADPLWCSYVLDPDLVPPQVAFAIGRAVGTAVRRNRLRRRLRALLASSDVRPGLYLIGAGPQACEHTFDDLDRSIRSMLDKIEARVSAA